MRALVIGSGLGGLSVAIRLAALGLEVLVLEKLDGPGGRARVLRKNGFTFDMGPTVITVPIFLEDLFATQPGDPRLYPDFPEGENLTHTSRYLKLVPLDPFYRIHFPDGSYFDYNNNREHLLAEIRRLAPEDLEGYLRFERDAKAIFQRGFLELGFTHFGSLLDLLKVAPDLLRMGAVFPLLSFVKRYFKNPKLQRIFSFESLLIGGNPLSVPALYVMIHFVERNWGVHFAMGGTGALVQGLVRKLEELGGRIRYNAPVRRILTHNRRVKGVVLEDGEKIPADVVVSNADYIHTYGELLSPEDRRWHSDLRLKRTRLSMSLFVGYFGFRAQGDEGRNLRHHNVLFSERYEGLLQDILQRKTLPEDFAHYLHLPTLTDPSLAPEGHHAAYTLVPVPHNGSGLDWQTLGPRYMEKALRYLDEAGYLPGLMERLVCTHFITPDYFQWTLNSHLGNGFGPEPILWQTASFRPHNRSEDVKGLYLVGQSYQPGAGLPSVMMSAKITARLIAHDLGLEKAPKALLEVTS
ncbi:phytoene dehydrogenase [Thermus scotoductus]|uniref:Phytoene dehydrogenase n=1 Tax=Thermus scotoductus TaxID=37636 RepID=A0A430SDZ2_THESC|nr:phytoene desaturase family protein [Thermus scotoductus]RTG98029.1 phytoene dehydrogenase [Thermus scotoductus]RTH13125.1 phytoene dehydrogenase [Thermus scotoductus]RTH13938.1 phytoene dehydrogenase [Thermus scotoductus]RTH15040.1 phytoene dehydrogenase [Thermus scotoductus]RTH20112.1 phytoene dehydrogenase [Thermus scotoductus]